MDGYHRYWRALTFHQPITFPKPSWHLWIGTALRELTPVIRHSPLSPCLITSYSRSGRQVQCVSMKWGLWFMGQDRHGGHLVLADMNATDGDWLLMFKMVLMKCPCAIISFLSGLVREQTRSRAHTQTDRRHTSSLLERDLCLNSIWCAPHCSLFWPRPAYFEMRWDEWLTCKATYHSLSVWVFC